MWLQVGDQNLPNFSKQLNPSASPMTIKSQHVLNFNSSIRSIAISISILLTKITSLTNSHLQKIFLFLLLSFGVPQSANWWIRLTINLQQDATFPSTMDTSWWCRWWRWTTTPRRLWNCLGNRLLKVRHRCSNLVPMGANRWEQKKKKHHNSGHSWKKISPRFPWK